MQNCALRCAQPQGCEFGERLWNQPFCAVLRFCALSRQYLKIGFEGREDHRIPFASAKSIEARCGWRQTWRSDGFESERRPNRKERVLYRPRSRNVLTGCRVFHPEGAREPFPCEARGVQPFPPSELHRRKA